MTETSTPGVTSSDVHLDTASKTRDELIIENEKLQKKAKSVAKFAFVLGIIALIALAAVVGILVNFSLRDDTPGGEKAEACGTVPEGQRRVQNLLGEPVQPGPFHDVTVAEIKKVRQYLEENHGIVKPEEATLADAHIYTIDLQPPSKADALAYLDNGASAPPRHARVVLFRGDLSPPVVEERICGPLDNITDCNVDVTVPFAQRPFEHLEYANYDDHLMKEVHRLFGTILQESYDASFDYEECEKCFNYFNYPVPLKRYGNDGRRRSWFVAMYDVEYYSLHPVDFGFLADVDGVDGRNFTVEKVWYSGTLYNSPQELIDAYNNGTAKKTRIPFPTEEKYEFSTLKHRGAYKPASPRRPPEMMEPDGKRYTVRHRKVEYLDMWSFYYRMSPIHGPVLYDIRYQGERIAYEVSLGELGVFYSGFNPMQRQVFIVDSAYIIGSRTKVLVAGADCPTSATFLPLTLTSQDREEPAVFPRAICIFEQNLGTPVRRHHAYSRDEGAFYGGMLDSVLVVRSIHAVDNYDYVVDFMFHQNGAMGASIGQTGYLLSGFYSPDEKPYGVKIGEYLAGPMHIHLANFKIDVDVGGTSNVYETLDIEAETVTLRQTTDEESQIRFSYKLKTTEQDAAYRYDFDKPMYHIFHNNASRNMYGERKSYRLAASGLANKMLSKDVGVENAMSWARYQFAVTRQKDEERISSSPYAQWGQEGLPTNFQAYIDDDENIVNEDLVAWVTLGVHHIPHTEDLPVTTTSGKHQSFHLIPYNYFRECPSMMSRDAMYVELADWEKPEEGLAFEYYGTGDVSKDKEGGVCEYKPFDTSSAWNRDPDSIFEVNEDKGVL